VTVSDDARATPLADHKAALDIGANTLVACTTTTGEQYLYEGRQLFQRFRETTREIARLQSKLPEGRYSSERIRRLYRKRTGRSKPTPRRTTSGRSSSSPSDWSAPPRNTVSRSKCGQRRGPAKSARSVVRQSERHGIRTRSPVRVGSRATPTPRRQKRS
jgi:hypothetical protein